VKDWGYYASPGFDRTSPPTPGEAPRRLLASCLIVAPAESTARLAVVAQALTGRVPASGRVQLRSARCGRPVRALATAARPTVRPFSNRLRPTLDGRGGRAPPARLACTTSADPSLVSPGHPVRRRPYVAVTSESCSLRRWLDRDQLGRLLSGLLSPAASRSTRAAEINSFRLGRRNSPIDCCPEPFVTALCVCTACVWATAATSPEQSNCTGRRLIHRRSRAESTRSPASGRPY
jgi:hypothetical protein